MTIQQALEKGAKTLKEKNIETPVKEAGVLLGFAMGKELSWLYAHPELSLSQDQLEKFQDCVQKRSRNVPFQYISNNQEFMSLNFYVDSNCLVPRPDTEILAEAALGWLDAHPQSAERVLDIGTGSGAIAVSVAYYCRNARIDAMDLSRSALKIARENAVRNHVQDRIHFFEADFLHWYAENPYAVVLSNPPYIARDALKDLMPGVREYEPQMALDGGDDGLLFYRAIASNISRLLIPGGVVFTEVGLGQAEQVKKLYAGQGLEVKVYKDLSGIDRVVSGIRDW